MNFRKKISFVLCSCLGFMLIISLSGCGHEHSMATETIQEATCVKAGIVKHYCQNCEYAYEENLPALHHTFDEGTIITEATCTTNGTKEFTCTRCGETKNETIAASHNYTLTDFKKATSSGNGKNIYSCSNCGDFYSEDASNPKMLTVENADYDFSTWHNNDSSKNKLGCVVLGQPLSFMYTDEGNIWSMYSNASVSAYNTKEIATDIEFTAIYFEKLKDKDGKSHSKEEIAEALASLWNGPTTNGSCKLGTFTCMLSYYNGVLSMTYMTDGK